MSDMMPKEDYEFIKNIQDYMLDSTNMKKDDAWRFAFCIWQSKGWLTKYLLNDAIDEIAKGIAKKCGNKCYYSDLCLHLSEIFEQLKEKANEENN